MEYPAEGTRADCPSAGPHSPAYQAAESGPAPIWNLLPPNWFSPEREALAAAELLAREAEPAEARKP